MAILLATILVIGRLSSDYSIGTSFSRGRVITDSCLSLSVGLVISLINISFNEIVVPKANYYSDLLMDRLKNTNVSLKEREFDSV